MRQAIEVVDSIAITPQVERMPLASARGFRLAQDIVADRDYPPFDRSLADGFAVRSLDVRLAGKGAPPQPVRRRPGRPIEEPPGNPVELKFAGRAPAGRLPERSLSPGEAIAVTTGAPIPTGADAVVSAEDGSCRGADGEAAFEDGDGDKRVRITRAAMPWTSIARRGTDCVAGAVVVHKGLELQPARIAAAAAIGAAEVDVYAKPRVGVLAVGDELASIDEVPGPGQIRNSNNLMLIALLQRIGCDVTHLGAVPEQPTIVRRALEQGLRLDALLVTGPMNVGTRDSVPRLLADLGVEIMISSIRLRPGKTFIFGLRSDSKSPNPCCVFGLPSNPVGAFVCTLRLASRVLARFAGGEPGEQWITGRLDAGLPANGPQEFYQPVVRMVPPGGTSSKSEMAHIKPLAWKGTGDLFTLAQANGLLVRGENEPPVPQGTMVRVLEI